MVKVGVNKFKLAETDEKTSIKAFKINLEEEEKQVKRLADLKRRRNNRAVMENLKSIADAARRNENTLPAILVAVKNYATIGEICDTLRDVWGDWTANPSLDMGGKNC